MDAHNPSSAWRASLALAWDSDLVYHFRHTPSAWVALVVALACGMGALLAPWVAPHNPFDAASLQLSDALLPPAWNEAGQLRYLLGTDDQGRDIVSALLYGARISLLVGLVSVILSALIGVSLGLISGFVGGAIDSLIMRVCDVMLSFPAILVALLISGVGRALFPHANDSLAFVVLILSISLTGWVQYARTVRGATMVERHKEYVQAARVTGVLGVMVAAFIAGTPYAVLDLPKFLNDYARLASIFARERGGDALPGDGLLDGVGRLGLQRRVGPGDDPVGADLTQPTQAQFLGLDLVHDHDGAAAVGDLRRRAGRDGSVLAECGLEAAERLGGGVGANALVLGEFDRVALALRDGHRHHLVGEHAVLPGGGGLLMRAGGEFVLLEPGELVGVVALLGQGAHRLVGEHVVQAVVGHMVEHRDVAVLVALPAVHQQVRGPGHRLLPAGHHDVELAGPNELVSQGDRVDAGQAHLVDRQGRHVPADACGHRGLAGRHLPGTGGQDLAHDHVVHPREHRTVDGWQVGELYLLQKIDAHRIVVALSRELGQVAQHKTVVGHIENAVGQGIAGVSVQADAALERLAAGSGA